MTHRLTGGMLGVSIAILAARAGAAGIFTFAPITGDADSGISPTKTYTHAVDFGAGGNSGGFPNIIDQATTVNGVPFTIGGPQGTNYSTTGLNAYVGSSPWTTAVPRGENSLGDLLNDFYWRNTPVAPADQTLTLAGLTPGTGYVTTFYSAGWQPGVTRVVTVTASDGGTVTFNQDFTGYTKPNVLRYAFVAAGTSVTYTFSPANPLNGFHQFAFTNEVAVPEPAGLFAVGFGASLLLARRPRK